MAPAPESVILLLDEEVSIRFYQRLRAAGLLFKVERSCIVPVEREGDRTTLKLP